MIRIGDRNEAVRQWRAVMNDRFGPLYTRLLGPLPRDTNEFGPRAASWAAEYQRRTGQLPTGEVSDDDLRALGIAPPAPAANRHLGLMFRGTGGIIGLDYVSRVMQAVANLVEEVHPEFAATMGGLPVGAAGGPGDISMAKAVDIAVADAQRVFLERHRVNPKIKVVIGGYSAGAVAAAKFRAWLAEHYPDNYLCSFSFGDPTRPYGGSYYGGPILAGQGISSWRFGDVKDHRHCWLTDPFDMYGNIPRGVVGDIMDDCFDMVTAFQLSDPLGAAGAILPKIPEVASKALGIELPAVFGALTGGPAGIAALGLPLVMGGLQGLLGWGDVNKLTGPAAAAQAAIIALRFVTANPPTAPHIQYEFREVWPGQTYLGLAVQHVRDWATRAPIASA